MAPPRTLAAILPPLTGKVMGRRGLAFGGLLTEWSSIIGPKNADRTTPIRVVFPHGQRENAVLHLRVASSAALDLQHLEPQIIERINGFFGYKAVARLKLIQVHRERPKGPIHRPRPLSVAEQNIIDASTGTIDDPDLSAALARFGRALYQSTPNR
ncbi:MAG: DciA family protein [Rhodospirillaceae bacterium]